MDPSDQEDERLTHLQQLPVRVRVEHGDLRVLHGADGGHARGTPQALKVTKVSAGMEPRELLRHALVLSGRARVLQTKPIRKSKNEYYCSV
eukprot:4705632-Pyramimonas_sp.AAC.1